jgi:glycogen debranching enzyme
MEKIITKARKIALVDLRSCYQKTGTLASKINFSDYWARDSFWAAIGVIEANKNSPDEVALNQEDLSQIKKSFDLFFHYQRTDGKIPRKICLDINSFKYLFKTKIRRKNPFPAYASAIRPLYSLDDNLLLVIAFCRYFEKTEDNVFTYKYFDQARKCLDFYAEKKLIEGSLLHETGLGNWQDTIFKRGFVLYVNCLWFEAVRSFEKISHDLEKRKQRSFAKTNTPSSSEIKSRIQKKFWEESQEYFADSVSRSEKKSPYFDLAGNLLAVVFGLANEKQTKMIFKKIDAIMKISPKALLHPLNHPRYSFWKINPLSFIFGIQNYQNQISWSWLEALLAIAYEKNGETKRATETLENLSKIIVKNGHVHETYYLDGQPFGHFYWKSAVPFAWGASLFFWAVSEYEKKDDL